MTSTPRPIRFPDDLWEEVKRAAEAEDRAPSNMVIRLVRAALSLPPQSLGQKARAEALSLLTPQKSPAVSLERADTTKPAPQPRPIVSRLDKSAYLKGGKAR